MVKKTGVSRNSRQSKPKDNTYTNESMMFVINAERAPRGEARYRDPSNSFNTWSGHGRRPEWLRAYLDQGRLLEEFEIAKKKGKRPIRQQT